MPTIRVGDLAQATLALATARAEGSDVVLASDAAVTAFAGVGYWRALEQALGHTIVVDCGDDAGLAMAALRAGSLDLLFTGPERLALKLADLAGPLGAVIRRGLDEA